jgi:membrane-bound lytic murein transglycosylase B
MRTLGWRRSVGLFGRWAAGLTVVTVVAGAVILLRQEPEPISRYDTARLIAATPVPAADSTTSRSGRRPRTDPTAVDPAWVTRAAAVAGIPVPAVRAYGTATLRLAGEQPGCRVGWTTLAGIGAVESGHGTIDGRVLLEDGRSSTPIIGPALDGAGDFAAIPATQDATALHGDPRWDHAVGPLQFLPGTWAQWGADADRDGLADAHDLDDAAYAAARYLCAGGDDLTTAEGWHRAVFSYNHAESYVASVYAAASEYATAG